MILKNAIDQYVGFRITLGERCKVNGQSLRSFSRSMGENKQLEDVTPGNVNAFLAGTGSFTSSWHVRHNALLGFYRYALSRSLVTVSPMPLEIPKRPPAFQPYIYSEDELRNLVKATNTYQRHKGRLDPRTVRTILLLLYGAALRVSEALRLTNGDLDLDNAVLIVRDSKFFKSRLVPLGPNLTQAMREYAEWRNARDGFLGSDLPFFVGRNSECVNISTLENGYQQLREHVGIRRDGGPRNQPRMHDLRHTSAVHRLIWCYRQGNDVQKFLAYLSIYMGHSYLAATQVYLTMTPELLHEANIRFENYASKEDDHG